MENFLQQEYFDNTVRDYLIAIGIIVIGITLLRLFRRTILKKLTIWAEKTETKADDLIVKGVERFGLPIMNIIVMYTGTQYLELSAKAHRVIIVAVSVSLAFFLIRLVSSTLQLMLESYIKRQEGGEEKVKQVRGVMLIINIVIWCIGLLVLADNLGYDITAIIAGLGIGGIAVALAAQNILGDLFNYFVIFFDRPFEVGDFIILDDKKGTVEYIGVTTTRLKSLSGEQLILSNSDLTKSRLHNYKRMDRRRIVFSIGVIYQTPADKLRTIPELLKEIITKQERATFDRAHFLAFGDFSLNFEIVYFVESAAFNDYADIQQAINTSIFEAFEQQGIEFAYPSQTIFMAKDSKADPLQSSE